MTDWMIARLDPPRLAGDDRADSRTSRRTCSTITTTARSTRTRTSPRRVSPGMTGLGFDKKKTGALDSLEVLFSGQQFAGKMTYLDERRDTVGLSALRLGSDPANLTEEQFDASLAQIEKRSKSGWVRQIKGNVVHRGPRRRAAPCWRWAGPATSLSSPAGPRRRTSSGRSPKRAACSGRTTWPSRRAPPNMLQARHWIDFYYDPENAAVIEAYVNYVCPVRRPGRDARDRSRPRQQPADLPAGGLAGPAPPVPGHERNRGEVPRRLDRGVSPRF